ncbi:hypothetical protein ACFXTI_012382 [Malus domestica]
MDNDYLSHLPSLFLRQIWYLFWKHKMLKMSTREQCQTSFIQGNLALEVRKTMPLRFLNKHPVGDLALEIRRTVPLRFLRKQSC